MRRREVEARLPDRQRRRISHGTVRIREITGPFGTTRRSSDGSALSHRKPVNSARNASGSPPPPQHPFEIAQGLPTSMARPEFDRGPRAVTPVRRNSGTTSLRFDAATKSPDRESHSLCQHPRRQVAEIAARHDDRRMVAARLPPPKEVAVKVVERLGNPPQQVDRIGRRHPATATERLVGKETTFTSRRQSSNVPATRSGWILPLSAVIWHSCRRLIFPSG